MVMQWDDDVYSLGGNNGAQTDMDIWLTNQDGLSSQDGITNLDGKPLFGFNRNNLGGDPIEVLPFNVNDTILTSILVTKASGPDRKFKYIIFRGEGRIDDPNANSGTIVGQANATGAITVGSGIIYQYA
jgi:hypothetical protein